LQKSTHYRSFIRDNDEYECIQRYIHVNPENWGDDPSK